ncbi:cytochrome c peroxidase [Bathymodiolus platifrons methanotrophic gill symbiont]|uniref:cytochrome-c peroxidase n=1 Tax=Bathymodiolus platifrons methanotrophic gill symbiont TaxID=113268 RepID=UPI000B416B48|nr:cytochrome-c peroxidase [Bathymodiolus platifrons methanotrophic gill symbiont]GAW86683.1 cytochrome c peroxidase [Bathymodiolus platifrons methanotrophic gill symbiont]GFO77407.1 cytochrome c peroxidase [Bathymodiolus platifrons methanotrophic gill symbiont]
MAKLIANLFLILVCSFARAKPLLNEPIRPIPDPVIKSAEQVEIGRLLFHDVRLSKNNQLSCASCHSLKYGGADGQVVSSGVNGSKGLINSPTVFNSSLNFRQFWDGRAANLLHQIDGPISNPIEMNSSWPEVLSKLEQDPFYIAQFKQEFSSGLTISNIKAAIVSFEESLLTPNSRFDLYLKNDLNALTTDELEGYQIFKQYGCISCHQGVAIGGNLYQRFGIMADYFADRGNITAADLGRFQVTHNEADRYVFKVPSLRNVALTAPYFHDGSTQNLDDAVAIMVRYQLGRVADQQTIHKIVLFLNTLTGQYQNKPL